MTYDEVTAQAVREATQLRVVLAQVLYDKSFCCLKECNQDAVRAALNAPPPGVSVVGSQPSSSHTTGKVRGTEVISFDPAQGPEVTER